jgi:Galactose oxidase, central domain/Kelch motif
MTRLPDGQVLAVGGVADCCEETVLASAELFDPATGNWSATESMSIPRARHTATLLPNGKVLVAGGLCPGLTDPGCPKLGRAEQDPDGAITLAELYDPATGTWSPTGSMVEPRFEHSATLLANGMVLVVGAEHAPDEFLASTELYDPRTGRWTAAGDMANGRNDQCTALLPSGRVLVAGGVGPLSPTTDEHGPLRSTELFDPKIGRWAVSGRLAVPRVAGGPCLLLGDGTVLMPGGGGAGDRLLASVEVYDAARGQWQATTSMPMARVGYAAVVLQSGEALLVGGFTESGNADPGTVVASNPDLPALVFNAGTLVWSDAGGIGTTGTSFASSAVVLRDGKVLVAGGFAGPSGPTASAYLFDPALAAGN